MKSVLLRLTCTACLAGLAVCCNSVGALLGLSDTVAEVGGYKLPRETVENLIPPGTSQEDSAAIASRYINSWKADRLKAVRAARELPKEECDVSREIEEYKVSLLKYRYEQHYIRQNLDTTVTPADVQAYYDGHQADFILDRALVRARVMKISADSPVLGELKEKLASESLQGASSDSLTFARAYMFSDFGGGWTEASALAGIMEMDPAKMLSSVKGGYVQNTLADGSEAIAYIPESIPSGQRGPVSYFQSRIHDLILGARRRDLLSELDNKLLSENDD